MFYQNLGVKYLDVHDYKQTRILVKKLQNFVFCPKLYNYFVTDFSF